MHGSIESAFIGRVATEPELRTSSAGKPWARFTVAVGQDDDTQWAQVAVFGDTAEHLAGSLKKGDRVYVEGRLKLNRWEKDGEQKSGLSVAAWKAEKLGQIGRNKPPRERDAGDPESRPNGAKHSNNVAASRDWQRPPADDSIPF
jgi:single-strand DNA-binding protein